MKTLGVVLSIVAVLAIATQLAGLARSPFAGTWQGKQNGLPAVTLTVQEVGGKLTGAIVFYLQKRDTVSAPWHIEGGAIEPLIDPQVDGRRLSFEVRHATEHGSSEYGPNVKMAVDLTGQNAARMGEIGLVRE